VWEVMKAMNGDKALGLNGYSMAFIQAWWVVLKEDVMKIFREFHASGKFERRFDAMLPPPPTPHSEDSRGC
jgi:hypothetical protein